jgi:glucuronosyltransferase
MPENVKEMFIRVFARIPQRVFWKWEAGTSDANRISSNVKMVDWLPQQDLLGIRPRKVENLNIRFC